MLLKKIKINIAIFIFAAFVFRLIFVNVGLVSVHNSIQSDSIIKRHFSEVLKNRRSQFDPTTNSCNYVFSSAEMLEEDTDSELQIKLNSFSLTFLSCVNVEHKIVTALKKIAPFNKHFSFCSNERFLEYGVFRI